MTIEHESQDCRGLFTSPAWYDRSINWAARFARELPVLTDVFGKAGRGGLVDAGCGPARQACALARQGYRVIAADLSQEMLAYARSAEHASGTSVEFVQASYAELADRIGGGHDGLYCLGNSLAAAGTREAVAEAVENFVACVRPGGRLFVQILNFEPMRPESPCVRGPRVSTYGGVEYISTRQFHFSGDKVAVSNTTLWQDGGWQMHARSGWLFAISKTELTDMLATSGLRMDALWGNYDREPFDRATSIDLIAVATRE